jgi:hypothetical protein
VKELKSHGRIMHNAHLICSAPKTHKKVVHNPQIIRDTINGMANMDPGRQIE